MSIEFWGSHKFKHNTNEVLFNESKNIYCMSSVHYEQVNHKQTLK